MQAYTPRPTHASIRNLRSFASSMKGFAFYSFSEILRGGGGGVNLHVSAVF